MCLSFGNWKQNLYFWLVETIEHQTLNIVRPITKRFSMTQINLIWIKLLSNWDIFQKEFLSHIWVNFLVQSVSSKPERGLDVSLRTIFQPLSDLVIYSAIESIQGVRVPFFTFWELIAQEIGFSGHELVKPKCVWSM